MNQTRVVSAAALLALATLGQGCTSNCGANCAPTEVQVWATLGESLNWTDAEWTGPACPSFPPSCRADDSNNCLRFDIIPSGPGTCDLTITFSDRPAFTAHGEFAADPHQACCHGFPVVGDAVITVPAMPGFAQPDAAAESGAGADTDAGVVDAPDASAD